MLAADFDYELPRELIAQTPAEPRDSARLLKLDRRQGAVSHHIFRELDGLIPDDCVLVFNQTRVEPRRRSAQLILLICGSANHPTRQRRSRKSQPGSGGVPDPAMSSLSSGERVTKGRCIPKQTLENCTPPDKLKYSLYQCSRILFLRSYGLRKCAKP